MNKKTKVLLQVGLAAALITGVGTAVAANNQQTVAGNKQHTMKQDITNSSALLALLQTDEETLKQELKSGKSLLDVAQAKGVSAQQVIDLLVQQRTKQIDQAVQSGKLTQEQANQIKSKLADQVKAMVERKGGNDHAGHHGFKGNEAHKEHGKHQGGYLNTVASVLGVTPKDLMAQLKAGKSIAQVAEEKGIAKQQLIDELLKKEKDRITKFVEKNNWGNGTHE